MAIEPPVLEQQFLNLSPRGRMVAGPVLLVLGAGTAVAFWAMGLIWFGSLFCLLFGPVLLVSGWRDQQRQQRLDAEVARAKREWEALRRDLTAARLAKQNVARLLQERGYQVFSVRQWIARELASIER